MQDDEIKAAAREWINREYWGPHVKSMEVTDPIRERDFCEGARWALKQDDWISIDERLPEKGTECLWVDENGDIQFAWLSNGKVDADEWTAEVREFTHWKPVRKPVIEEEEK